MFKYILFGSLYLLSHLIQAQLIAEGATPIKLSDQFSFTEGPTSDSKGNVYFTDQPNNKIYKWQPNGKISLYMNNSGRSNGLFFHDGILYACADEKNELWKISKSKKVSVLLKGDAGSKFNGPNDLWIAHNGDIYFTDPFYKRDYWANTDQEIEKMNAYRYTTAGELSIADDDLVKPNGIVGNLEGTKLYVADIGASKTYVYTINSDGTLSNRKLFAEMGSDGMTIDEQGNLYLTGKGVTIFNATGEIIEKISIDEPWTANICFGGKQSKTLFITASKAVYTLEMKVSGR